MPERLKKDVWRCLKTLKREYEDQSTEDKLATPPEDYARLGAWDQKKKQDRRRMQNRKAARRFRVKNLEVVWAMVTSYEKCKAENEKLRQQVKTLGGDVPDATPTMPRLSLPSLPPPVDTGATRIKSEPVSTPRHDQESTVTPAEIIKIPPPLPPLLSGKKRKLENGQALAMPPAGAAWIVQKNAVDLIQQDLLTLTVVCGKQDLANAPDKELVQRLSVQANRQEFSMQNTSLSGSSTPVRAPKQWIEAIQMIAKGE